MKMSNAMRLGSKDNSARGGNVALIGQKNTVRLLALYAVVFTLSAIRAARGDEPASGSMPRLTIENNQFAVHGKPFQIISGEMHPSRIPHEYWHDRLLKAKAMGLNTIAIYVFWNVEEPKPGKFDFTGQGDIAQFVKMAGDMGLYIFLRPGPYVCAEWEFGGYPAWLLKQHDLVVRSNDPRYLAAATEYLNHLAEQLVPLQNTRGGPIVMVQVENEYGFFGKDHDYMARCRDMVKAAGFDVPLVTADGPSQTPIGHVPGTLPGINGGGVKNTIKAVDRFNPGGPYLITEWYPGWLDHWGEAHSHRDAEKTAQSLDEVLSAGISVNMYMVHGGTDFGFMNGANGGGRGHFQPQPTSYDYDSPIDEAGHATPKYFKLRDVIAKHLPTGTALPDVPPDQPVIDVPRFKLPESASLFDALPQPVKSRTPLSMEDVDQAYGYILYRTTIDSPVSGSLVINDLRDYAVVLVNGKKIGSLDRRDRQNSIDIEITTVPAKLDILVENGGRINFSRAMLDNRKGITKSVSLAGNELTGWEIFPLPMDHVQQAPFSNTAVSGPSLRRGMFHLTQLGDTFLDMRGWGKGAVWVNGHNLGRFWSIGPQQTLYLPAPWLKIGDNEIIALDIEDRGFHTVAGLKIPILNKLEADPNAALSGKP